MIMNSKCCFHNSLDLEFDTLIYDCKIRYRRYKGSGLKFFLSGQIYNVHKSNGLRGGKVFFRNDVFLRPDFDC